MSFENAFYRRPYSSVADALSSGLDEQVWRWGLVFNQGNDWSVSENRVRERLRNIRMNLLRAIFGNRHRGKGSIRFLRFQARIAEIVQSTLACPDGYRRKTSGLE